MTLSKDYKLISTSAKMPPQSGAGYGYFTEVYARAIPDETTGIYTVYLKLMLTCTINSSFYQYLTSFSGSIGNVSVFSGTNKPWSAWSEKSSIGTFATTISEGSTTVDASDGLEHRVELATVWEFDKNNTAAHYTPYWGATAVTSDFVTLDAIPRAAKIGNLASSNGALDGKITYLVTPTNNYMTIKERVFCRDTFLYEKDLGEVSKTQTQSINLDGYFISIYEKNTDTSEIPIKVILTTYYNEKEVGESEQTVTLKVPDSEDTRPTLDSISISPKYPSGVYFGTATVDPPFVARKSYISVQAEGYGKYGAGIADTVVTLDGKSYNIIDLLTGGNKKLTVQLRDTRGIMSDPYSVDLKVYDYRPPLIVSAPGESEVICYRCDSNGKADDTGKNLYLKFKRQYSDIPGNSCYVSYRTREEKSDWKSDYESIHPVAFTDNVFDGVIYDIFTDSQSSYYFQLKIIDGGNEFSTKTIPIPAEWTDYQYDGDQKSWSFGEAVPSGRPKSFSLGLKAYFDKGSQPIPFYEGEEIYTGEVKEEDLLQPVSTFKEFTLFMLICAGVTGYALGIRIGDDIRLVGFGSYIKVGTESITLVQGDGFDQGADLKVTHIYGLL